MGTFTVSLQIADITETQTIELEALVETGTTYTTLPMNIISQLGIEEHGTRRFELADNKTVEYPVGYARIMVEGQETITQVVFAPEETSPLVGATILQLLSLGVDPVNHRLIPIPALMK